MSPTNTPSSHYIMESYLVDISVELFHPDSTQWQCGLNSAPPAVASKDDVESAEEVDGKMPAKNLPTSDSKMKSVQDISGESGESFHPSGLWQCGVAA